MALHILHVAWPRYAECVYNVCLYVSHFLLQLHLHISHDVYCADVNNYWLHYIAGSHRYSQATIYTYVLLLVYVPVTKCCLDRKSKTHARGVVKNPLIDVFHKLTANVCTFFFTASACINYAQVHLCVINACTRGKEEYM